MIWPDDTTAEYADAVYDPSMQMYAAFLDGWLSLRRVLHPIADRFADITSATVDGARAMAAAIADLLLPLRRRDRYRRRWPPKRTSKVYGARRRSHNPNRRR